MDEDEFPISHVWQHVPVHLLGPGVDLDRRNPGVAGAARAPQAMVQDLLNRSEHHQWAFLSNGLRLRVLRDSTSLAGSAYIEFDLVEIFDGLLFDEFLLLWQLCHVSRVEKRGGIDAPPGDCWLESWREDVRTSGTRALAELRVGVETALEALGSGFLGHPDNHELRVALQDGALTREEFHRALLRLVYRLLFLSVAEDRALLHAEGTRTEIKHRYAEYFSVGRLRRLARVRTGGPHADLWESLRLVLAALGGEGLPQLGIPALAGLFDPADRALDGSAGTVDLLGEASLANKDLLAAMYSLGWIRFRGQRVQPVDYRNLDAEELGSIYESLLELVPRVDTAAREFRLEKVSGNDRKTSGSYYTPTSLVNALLDSALDPLLTDARKNAANAREWESNLLALTVCDPACGSGHFLVAAARRVARELAEARSGEDEPTPADVHHALRDVVGRCLYGVDVNPMAAELAKVSLWLEALEPGKPLGFLDARIRVGNSLLGTTPALLAGGVPDEAFKPLEGDDKSLVNALKKRNKQEREGQQSLFAGGGVESNTELADHRDPLLQLLDDPNAVRTQAARWELYDSGDDKLARQRAQADTWCAAFVWKLYKGCPDVPTTALVRTALDSPDAVPPEVGEEVTRLAEQYGFFHWHLEFPEVFEVAEDSGGAGPEGWSGGFSVLLGNPPWERVKLQEQEFFAARDPEIARAPNKAARKALIDALVEGGSSPSGLSLHRAYLEAKRQAEGESALLRNTNRFPLTGRGDVNTYAVFAETFRALTGPYGRSGVIVPTGIATDATTQYFFKDLVETASLAKLYDFENRRGIFEDVDSRTKFSLLTVTGREQREPRADFAFFLHDPADIEAYSFSMTPEEILLLNPNTGTCPVFRSRRDAEITLGIYKRVPVLVKDGDPDGNPWGISFMTMFHMSNDSHLFHTREQLEADGWTLDGNIFTRGEHRMLPLYEAKMIHHYDHRWATYENGDFRDVTLEEKYKPASVVLPRYWVSEQDIPVDKVDKNGKRRYVSGVASRLENSDWHREWLLGWRDISRSTDERTMISSVTPRTATPDGTLLMLPAGVPVSGLISCLSSFVFDFATRQKVGGTHLKFYTVYQLPVASPSQLEGDDAFFESRVLELTYTAHEMAPFALDMGDTGAPFHWDEERRPLLRAELDAAFLHLYGVNREDADYIMETFPIVKRKDEKAYGEYRTKRFILEIYDRMAEAIRTGKPYQTILDPPPGQGFRHPERALAKEA
ncbi:Eco57I restriction-modification methylase domain-containing protein [Allosaccharopolyspora coralli]|uniref:Eco57I restriction-modification methylase domain-containing protein n=1 Tax=Allosaccharopolyspora coralli TaxID=2665642 RepID=UPI001E5CE0CD|nr:DNA methyltransferase [Allosaccharopolyspora coralli]